MGASPGTGGYGPRGRRDQAKGSIKQYGPKIKDTIKRILPGAVRGPMTFTLAAVAGG